jgi:hypothetical protein
MCQFIRRLRLGQIEKYKYAATQTSTACTKSSDQGALASFVIGVEEHGHRQRHDQSRTADC